MNILLDSCAFVDIAIDSDSLTKDAIAAYQNSQNDIYLSVATVWELGLKKSLGKLSFDINGAIELLGKNGIKTPEITLPVTLLVNELPYHHKDSFDRIIVATAKIHDLTVMTSDPVFAQYGLEIIHSRM